MTKFLSSTDLIRTLLRAVLYLVIGLALVFHTPEFRYVETTGKSFAHIAGIAVCVLAALTALTGGFVRNTSSEAKALSGPHRTDFTPLALLGRSHST
ncbi:MAG: hypothetical protein ACTIJ6_00950 [Leucobacter sp.]